MSGDGETDPRESMCACLCETILYIWAVLSIGPPLSGLYLVELGDHRKSGTQGADTGLDHDVTLGVMGSHRRG